jgi:hypothetical protein
MEDVVYDGWDVSVAHTVSLQVIFPLTLFNLFHIHFHYQMQCQRCKCRLSIVFPPEGVPSLDILLDTGSFEQAEADLSEGDDDERTNDNGGQAAEESSESDGTDQNQEADEPSELDDSSSDGDSDADNGMGRKAGAVRVMVESFADRCAAVCVSEASECIF